MEAFNVFNGGGGWSVDEVEVDSTSAVDLSSYELLTDVNSSSRSENAFDATAGVSEADTGHEVSSFEMLTEGVSEICDGRSRIICGGGGGGNSIGGDDSSLNDQGNTAESTTDTSGKDEVAFELLEDEVAFELQDDGMLLQSQQKKPRVAAQPHTEVSPSPLAFTSPSSSFGRIAQTFVESEREDALSAISISAAIATPCSCIGRSVSCIIGSNLTMSKCHDLRTISLDYPIRDGSRARYFAGVIQSLSGLSVEGERTRKYNLQVNGVAVCADVFCAAYGISRNLLRTACEMDLSSPRIASSTQKSREVLKAEALDCSIDRMNAVAWIIHHAKSTGCTSRV